MQRRLFIVAVVLGVVVCGLRRLGHTGEMGTLTGAGAGTLGVVHSLDAPPATTTVTTEIRVPATPSGVGAGKPDVTASGTLEISLPTLAGLKARLALPDDVASAMIHDPGIVLVRQDRICRTTGNEATAEFVDTFTGAPPALQVERVELHPAFTPIRALTVRSSLAMPVWATQGTVFLNGWTFRYLDGAHEVAQVTVDLANVEVRQGRLHWAAIGILQGEDNDLDFEFCHDVMAVLWNPAYLDIEIFHGDDHFYGTSVVNNAATVSPTICRDGSIATGAREAAVLLPRGFLYHWHSFDAYPLRQLALLFGSVSDIAPGDVDWSSCGLLQHDDRDVFFFRDYASALAGPDAEQIFVDSRGLSSAPSPQSNCIGGTVERMEPTARWHTSQSADYLIPVMTHWQLERSCHEEKIVELGAGVTAVHFEPGEHGEGGTMHWDTFTVMRDTDRVPGHQGTVSVDLLALKTSGLVTGEVRFENGVVGFTDTAPERLGGLRNAGNTGFFVTGAALGGPHPEEFALVVLYGAQAIPVTSLSPSSGVYLAPGDEIMVSGHFTPSDAGSGVAMRLAWVEFQTTDPQRPRLRVTLTGYAHTPNPGSMVSAALLDLGTVERVPPGFSQPMATGTLTLHSTGSTPLIVTNTAVLDASLGLSVVMAQPAEDDLIPVNSVLLDVPSGTAVPLQVRFVPQGPGVVSTQVVVETNAGNVVIAVQATGINSKLCQLHACP